MVPKVLFVRVLVLISCLILACWSRFHNHNLSNLNFHVSFLAAIELPDHVNALSSSTISCTFSSSNDSNEELAKGVVLNDLEHGSQSLEKFGERI